MLPRRDSQSCTLAPAKLKRFGWGGIWKRRPSHCTTLSLLTMRSWTTVHVFCEHLSPVDESACNPKPKSLRQTGRNPLNVGGQRSGERQHNGLANYRFSSNVKFLHCTQNLSE